jgi:hypothetical protein
LAVFTLRRGGGFTTLFSGVLLGGGRLGAFVDRGGISLFAGVKSFTNVELDFNNVSSLSDIVDDVDES